MILRASQEFKLAFEGSAGRALDFVRSPELALASVRFLRDVQVIGGVLSGMLVVKAPVLGDIDLPFQSELVPTPDGGDLQPLSLISERAWVSVAGQSAVMDDQHIQFAFQFEAHVTLPEAGGWGGSAFEKMVNAAAGRTLTRVTEALPIDIQAALKTFQTEV